MAEFLLTHLDLEIRAQQVANLSFKLHKNKVTEEKIYQLEINCCMDCSCLFYINVFVIRVDDKDVHLCATCAAKNNKGEDICKRFVCNISDARTMLANTIDSSIGITKDPSDPSKCAYINHKGSKLQRFDDPNNEKTTLQVVCQLRKTDHIDLLYQNEEEKLEKRTNHKNHNKQEPKGKEIQKVIDKNMVSIKQLKKRKS